MKRSKTAAAASTAVTGKASSVTEKGATLNATVNPDGTGDTKCIFEYGTSATPYEKTAPCATLPGSGTNPVAVSAAISDLSASTTYHFRIVAENASRPRAKEQMKRSKPWVPRRPSRAMPAPSPKKGRALSATVNPDGIAVTACTFEYGSAAFFAMSRPTN